MASKYKQSSHPNTRFSPGNNFCYYHIDEYQEKFTQTYESHSKQTQTPLEVGKEFWSHLGRQDYPFHTSHYVWAKPAMSWRHALTPRYLSVGSLCSSQEWGNLSALSLQHLPNHETKNSPGVHPLQSLLNIATLSYSILAFRHLFWLGLDNTNNLKNMDIYVHIQKFSWISLI